MAGLLDDDYGASGIAAGMKGFLTGLQQMQEYNLAKEGRDLQKMEIESRMKADAETKDRQRIIDEVTRKREEREQIDRRLKLNLDAAEKGYDIGQDDQLIINPSRLALRQQRESLRAQYDPYGIKGMQAEKLSREQKQAMEGFKLPPDKVLQVQQGAQIPKQLADLSAVIESNKNRFGPVEGRLGSMNPYDTQAQTIDSQMRASSQAFGRYMEGGVLRKEDEDKYRKMFPQLNDTPDVARNKLAVVNRLLTQKQNADVSALRDQGYDVRAFGLLPEGKLPLGLVKDSPQGAVQPGPSGPLGGNKSRIFKTNEIEWK